MATKPTSGSRSDGLVTLGRIAMLSFAAYVGVAALVLLRRPDMPMGTYCERGSGKYEHNCLALSVDKPDKNPKTIGQARWSTSPEHPREHDFLSVRRGKSDHVQRYELYLPDGSEPFATIEDDDSWLIFRLAADPSAEHWLKTDELTWTSWAR